MNILVDEIICGAKIAEWLNWFDVYYRPIFAIVAGIPAQFIMRKANGHLYTVTDCFSRQHQAFGLCGGAVN